MGIKFKRPILYGYNPVDKVFTGQTEADIDQASLAHNELEFLIPAFTTDIKPPDAPRGSRAVWNGEAWDIVADHRGERWWQGDRPVFIETLGDPSAAGLTKDRPEPPAPPPPDPVATKRSELSAKLNEVTMIGSSFVALKQRVPDDIVEKHASIVDELRALGDK